MGKQPDAQKKELPFAAPFFMGWGSNYLEVSNGSKKGMAASIVEYMVYLEIRCESSHEVSQLKIVIKWGRLKRLKTRKCRWPKYEPTANRQAAG